MASQLQEGWSSPRTLLLKILVFGQGGEGRVSQVTHCLWHLTLSIVMTRASAVETKERNDCGKTNSGEGGQNERRRYGHYLRNDGPPERSSLNKGASTKISSSEARSAKQKETSICGNEIRKTCHFGGIKGEARDVTPRQGKKNRPKNKDWPR